MEEISTMTLRPTLSTQRLISGVGTTYHLESHESSVRDVRLVQASSEDSDEPMIADLRKTVSILAIAPTKMQHPAVEATGATVFVGTGGTSNVSPANSTANKPAILRRNNVPEELQTVNGYGTRYHQEQQHQHQQQPQKETKQQVQSPPVLGQRHLPQQSQQSTQSRQSAQHVVKIRINPEIDTGRVISTVRLNPDNIDERFQDTIRLTGENTFAGDKNGTTIVDRDISADSEEIRSRRDNDGRLNDRVNTIDKHSSIKGESCVRISVVSGEIDKNTSYHRSVTPQSPLSGEQRGHTNDMVQQQRGTANDSVNATSMNRGGGACFYYGSFPNSITTMMMSSGQCSPSDTLDSGTCSDLDGTPPPLPKKKNSSTILLGVGGTNNGTSPIIGVGKSVSVAGQQQSQHNRAGSVTSSGPEVDSDDNESNISCDSLNSSELASRISENQNIRVNGSLHDDAAEDNKLVMVETNEKLKEDNCPSVADDDSAFSANGGKVMIFGVKDVRDDINDNENENNNNNINNNKNNKIEEGLEVDLRKVDEEMNERNNGNTVGVTTNIVDLNDETITASSSSTTRITTASPCVSPSTSCASSLSKASTTPRVRSPVSNGHATSSNLAASPVIKECTYEERKLEQDRINEETAAADYYANYNRKNGTKYLYDDDRFYKFHINEKSSENENNDDAKVEDKESDEYFAGYKILDREAIRSAKGTVRGVKNRVRAGIATFLQKPSTKNYKTKDAGKIVVYTTSMSIVRETYFACIKMLQMLKTHMVKHEVRDMFMSRELQTELKERIGCETIEVPQLFIDGQYIGNADAVERLNESGELRRMFKPYKSPDACTTCVICGGCRLLPCQICNGSKKSPVRNDFMKEFYWLRCMNCDEVGLVKCKHC